jgi:hypothetical protein
MIKYGTEALNEPSQTQHLATPINCRSIIIRNARRSALKRLVLYYRGRRHAARNIAIVLLVFEIELPTYRVSMLGWRQVLSAGGIGSHLSIKATDHVRPTWPRLLCVELRCALITLYKNQLRPRYGAVIREEAGDRTDVQLAINYIAKRYHAVGRARGVKLNRNELPTRASRLTSVDRLKGQKVRF